ncbi:Na+/H+ antiporter NhaC family protein [Domibacillus aminovorans]|uniref:Na+/H+ antiporter NhaC-like C-terminal domain-containing protein n=1 Tax=Domibacillus aminovorans TaxID=29332 RepID=A0A177LBR1_9BACI|nr:Na+/H+ antiporter NhaC family protein [Domibacillus aminovorans]OAH63250.1 hypothetical protein AWH49_06790 [Domibacillus aminovorans]
MQMIPMNYYIWAVLGMVFVVALLNRDFGPMKKHEDRAIQTGEVVFHGRKIPAVLADSVFGDHCSPIHDTIILSSTGAGSNHIDHVMTQIPYALLSAVIAMIGYLMLGFTGSTFAGLFVTFALLGAIAFSLKKKKVANQ